MSQQPYTQPPPNYSQDGSSKSDQAPLLAGQRHDAPIDEPYSDTPARGGKANAGGKRSQRHVPAAWLDDDGEQAGSPAGNWQDEDRPMVSQSSIEIRNAFVRKVYSILFFQITATAVVGALCRTEAARSFLLTNSWTIFIPLLGSFACLLGLYWKRHSSPANLILLSLFTVLEGLGVGAAVAFIDTVIVLEAICLTALIFLGLTLYTFQTKRDFGGAGTYLYTALWVLILTSLLAAFFPYSRGVHLVFAGVGAVLFSFYIIYDTQLILQRLSPDEWVLANISLYLDIINLFLSIVRILSDTQDR